MDILVIVAALVILLALTLKKIPIVISALLSAAFMAAGSGMPVYQTIAEKYMGGFAGFAKSIWLILLFGAVLSKIMDHTGAAESIARFVVRWLGVRWVIPAIVISGGILAYGGISGLAACYALYPITLVVFREADLPVYLMPAVIGAGVHTWANMLPGTPSVVNIAPTTYLNTTATAAPAVGIFGAACTIVLTLLYFEGEVRRARKRGNHFEAALSGGKAREKANSGEERALPNPLLVLCPIVCVAVVMNVLKQEAPIGLLAGILLCGLLFGRNLKEGRAVLASAATEAANALVTASSMVGLGSVIRATPGFQDIVEWVLSFREGGFNPLLIYVAAVILMSGMNASAMSGMSTILSALADFFLGMGIPAALLHRVGVIAAIGPGALPHSSGMVMLLEICGVSYKEGYRHLFAVVVVVPLLTLLAVLACVINFG